jgi:hypothetical protein
VSGIFSHLILTYDLTEIAVIKSYDGYAVMVKSPSSTSLIFVKSDIYLASHVQKQLDSRGIQGINCIVALDDTAETVEACSFLIQNNHVASMIFDKKSAMTASLTNQCKVDSIEQKNLSSIKLAFGQATTVDIQMINANPLVRIRTPQNTIAVCKDSGSDFFKKQIKNCQAVVMPYKNYDKIDAFDAKYVIILNEPKQTIYSNKNIILTRPSSVTKLLLRNNGQFLVKN